MTRKRVVLRAAADRDVREAVEFYLAEGAPDAALKFIDVLEDAFQQLERHPAIGSTRYAHELDLPGLRCWPLKAYPHIVFYVEREDHLDVWRVLHGGRDVPSWLQTAE